LHYSKVFHSYPETLAKVSARVALGFHNLKHNDKMLKARSVELFTEFSEATKPQQHKLLDDYQYIEALFDIATCLSNHRDLMEYVMPTIDAILC